MFLVGGANSLLPSAAIALSIGVLLRGIEEGHHELVHEVEERTRAEAEREHLEAKLHDSYTLEAMGRLASGVVHDVNNLLVLILANAEELRRVPGTPQSRSALDDIVVSAERGRDLGRRVLALSRRDAGSACRPGDPPADHRGARPDGRYRQRA